MISVAQAFPDGWREKIGTGRLTLGLDLATTTNKTSNPSSFALIEEVTFDYIIRLGMCWKTDDPEVTLAILREVSKLPDYKRVSGLAVDGTNERFFAARIKREFAPLMRVQIINSANKIVHLGEEMNYKCYLGNLFVNYAEEDRIGVPNEPWVKDNYRQISRQKGTFESSIDANGNHGDFFDGSKLALHMQVTGTGPVEAEATPTGSLGSNPVDRKLKNPHAHKFGGKKRDRCLNV